MALLICLMLTGLYGSVLWHEYKNHGNKREGIVDARITIPVNLAFIGVFWLVYFL